MYNNNSRDTIFVLWKSLKEWEDYFYDSVTRHHRIDSLETLEYIMTDDESMTEEYYGIDRDLLIIILKRLEKMNKCIVRRVYFIIVTERG